MVDCEKFVLDRWVLEGPKPLGGDQRCYIVAVLRGTVRVEGDPAEEPLTRGGTMLLPAAAGPVQIEPEETAVLMVGSLP